MLSKEMIRMYTGPKGFWLDFKPQNIAKARNKFAHQMNDDETPSCIPLNHINSVKIEKTNVTALGIGSMPHLIINGQYVLYTDIVNTLQNRLFFG